MVWNLHLFRRRRRAASGRRDAAEAAPAAPYRAQAGSLSDEARRRLEVEVRRMIAEYRLKPTQEKEDGLGVEIARLPATEREFVTTVLLRIVAEERG